jgi:site-specific DNA-methyltransferase (adenine-specific)
MIELTGYQDKHEYVNKHGVKSVVYLMDNMDAMAQMGDKEFSLAVVDPPYGIGANKMTLGNGKRKLNRGSSDWDKNAPDPNYFDRIKSVSSNQIIWGANHFLDNMPFLLNSSCWIIWDKGTGDNDYADAEIAWTSYSSVIKKFHKSWVGANAKERNEVDRMHPTQKPIALYDWIFHNYAKPNDTIFDSHCGSGSSRIAADKHNLPYLATELDADYFYAHCKRFDRYTAQLTLF